MRFYSAGEVAGMFGVSRMTIYRAINDGTIPAIQVRDRWVVPAVAIDGMVQGAIARAEALSATRRPEDDVGLLDRYVDRPRPGANQTGAGSPVTQQGARGDVYRMAYSGSGARAAGGAR
jgi:excisionase family DNA binding protein